MPSTVGSDRRRYLTMTCFETHHIRCLKSRAREASLRSYLLSLQPELLSLQPNSSIEKAVSV